ncbi:sulfurtransferase [Sulfuricystis multivorans]|uniref:sulfurtransferase n=1 Tax=Sulfuricystis multivorans TaxID=2211108 RepID=UPI000F841EF7|nr:rhodanese-like domain-containing protein [Sulfuricystis multivorans]
MFGNSRFTEFSLLILLLLTLTGLARAAAPDFLVDAGWLESRLKDPKTVVLEVRYFPHRYATVGHIPGAVQVARFKDLGDNDHPVLMRLPAREVFQATLRRWGVNDDSTLVLYDDSRSVLAARLYFLLDYYGFDMRRVKILDGGTVEWTAFNELAKETAPRKPGKVTLKPGNRAMIAEWTEVYERVVVGRDPQVVLIDSRPKDMYTGKLIRHSVQGGHIPGAVNVVSLDLTDAQSQKWLSLEQIAAAYKDIPKDATIITYCHDGFRSALAWLQLKALGYRNVRFMNGGWSQWDRSLTLPVVQGDKPYDEDFSL